MLALDMVHIGDARALASRLAPQSVNTIVTSPPYFGLRSYLATDHPDKAREMGGEATPDEFVAALVGLFAALRPALRDDGTLWVNLGDSYCSTDKWGGGGGSASTWTSGRWGGRRGDSGHCRCAPCSPKRDGGGRDAMSLRVLIGCEFSGTVRRAFRDRGHDAWSCDLLPAEDGSPYHLREDVRAIVAARHWDLAVFHPPCTHLAVSGARWFEGKRAEQEEALAFVRWFLAAPVPRIAVENPVSIISSRIRRPDQIVQPHHFGHGETKTTCLWLKNLPPLFATHLVPGRPARVHRLPPSLTRWKERSRTYPGIAAAMAQQWGVG